MKSTIKVNWFVDFDKEEEWLNKMSSDGLCLFSHVFKKYNETISGKCKISATQKQVGLSR